VREFPSLRTLTLRVVGPPSCNPEVTFGGPRARSSSSGADSDSDSDDDEVDDNAKQESSKLLNKKRRKSSAPTNYSDDKEASIPSPPKEPTMTSRLLRSLRVSTLSQKPYSGAGRPNANDVDISHPWIMAAYPPRDSANIAPLINVDGAEDGTSGETTNEFLTIENGNHAVECLQLFIDALVESGRAGDSRMGVHFFREWVAAVTGKESTAVPKKKKKSKKKQKASVDESLPLGSLSLHNYAAGSTLTFRSMEKANVGSCLGTLDITGVHGLTDTILSNIICGGSFPRLRRLSVKNCRKLTGKGIAALVKLPKLCALDLGGCFNIHPNDVVSLIQNHPSTKKGRFQELYASGLGWTDVALEEIVDATAGSLRGLGVGFSPYISGPGLILILSKLASTLDHLAVPFCPGMDDAVTSELGKKLLKLAVLDIRGCNKVNSLSGMMEGRAVGQSQDDDVATAGHLFVLARYSGISNNSLEETIRLYESERLTCILDGGGIGGGIRR